MDGDTLEVFEVQVNEDDLNKLDEVRPRSRKKRSREEGFGGTGLLGFDVEGEGERAQAGQADPTEDVPPVANDSAASSASSSSSAKKRKTSSSTVLENDNCVLMGDDRIPCRECTFLNHPALVDCEVCNNPLTV